MKIAILHEMLVKLWGAEKVLESLLRIFPDADVFTLIYDEKKVGKVFPREKIKHVPKSTQRIYDLTKNQRLCLLFMAKAVESFDFGEYDAVIASSSAFSHWAITKPETKFIVYYHSPSRYLWDWTNEYKSDIGWNNWIKWLILNRVLLKLRMWDYMAAQRNDISIANSKNVQNRIKKYYWKESDIIYPPVDSEKFQIWKPWKYYIIISALTEFKRIDVAISAFNKMPKKKLIIIWTWRLRKKLEKLTEWKNITFNGFTEDSELKKLVENAKWLVFPWEEDFGIVPVEAMFAWKPVFALKAWWVLETVIENTTWSFFEDKNWKDFVEKFEKFDTNIDAWKFDSKEIRSHAMKFSEKIFAKKIKRLNSL